MINMKNKTKYQGKSSLEKLYHFQCAKCKKWWSIGDADKTKKSWFCPWCGIKQKIKL